MNSNPQTALPRAAAQADEVKVNTGAMLSSGASIGSVRLASDLIRHVWWPEQAPFDFSADALCARLQEALPDSSWSAWRIRRYQAWAQVFFRQTGEGGWVPADAYYEVPVRGALKRPLQASAIY